MTTFMSGFVPDARIEFLLEALAARVVTFDWAFVCVDSARGKTLRALQQLIQEKVGASAGAGGEDDGLLWIAGSDLVQVDEAAHVVVPYSAAYVFPAGSRATVLPTYNLTSECETFSERAPAAVTEYLSKTEAVGFFADGDGLNYCAKDEALAAAVEALRRRSVVSEG